MTQLLNMMPSGNSLVAQWLGLHASPAVSTGLIPGWRTKILKATWPRGKKKKKKQCLHNNPQVLNGGKIVFAEKITFPS